MNAAYISVLFVAGVVAIFGLAVAGDYRGHATRFALRGRARWLEHRLRFGAYPTPIGVRCSGIVLTSFAAAIAGLAVQRLGMVQLGNWIAIVAAALFVIFGLAGGLVIPAIAMRAAGVKRYRRH
jgi:hypothetical protein